MARKKRKDLHDADREFLAWVRAASVIELQDMHAGLSEAAWGPDRWKTTAIERELQRRGAAPSWW